MHRLLPITLGLTLLALPGAAAAQSSNDATMTVTATVLSPINVTVDQSLDFGNVLPGLTRTVASNDVANAGRFAISGNANSEVDLDLGSLPATLADGANSMPITWNAGFGPTAAAQSQSFAPAAGATTNLTGGSLFVFLGGEFTPAADQAAGTYSADVTLTVSYTGN